MNLLNHLFALIPPTALLGTCLTCTGSLISEEHRPIQHAVSLVDEVERFVLPFSDSSWADRFLEIRRNRDGYQYGPPLLGNTSFFLTGILGEARVRNDKQLWFRDVQYITENVNKELPLAGQDLATVSLEQDAPTLSVNSDGTVWWFTKSFEFCCYVRASMERNHPRRRIIGDVDELDTRSFILHGKALNQSLRCEAIASCP